MSVHGSQQDIDLYASGKQLPPIIAPASDGGLLVQGIQQDQNVQINLREWPNTKVTINRCSKCMIRLYGSCGEIQIVSCKDVTIMIDQVNTMASMVDCEFCNFAVAGDVPPVKLQRLQSCNVIATWDGLKEPIETHTCKGINVYALHDTSANIAVDEIFNQRDTAEVVDILDGIGLIQVAVLYQHLVRKAGIGISLQQVNDPRGGTRYRVEDLLPNAPAVLSGVQQGDILLTVDDVEVSNWSPNMVNEAVLGPIGTWCKLGLERNEQALPAPIMVLRSHELRVLKNAAENVRARATVHDKTSTNSMSYPQRSSTPPAIYQAPAPASYQAPPPASYQAPLPVDNLASPPVSYQAPLPTSYQSPSPPVSNRTPSPPASYQAPAPVSYQAPAPVSYQAPAPVSYQAPAPVSYQAPAPVSYQAPAPAPAPVSYQLPVPVSSQTPSPPASSSPKHTLLQSAGPSSLASLQPNSVKPDTYKVQVLFIEGKNLPVSPGSQVGATLSMQYPSNVPGGGRKTFASKMVPLNPSSQQAVWHEMIEVILSASELEGCLLGGTLTEMAGGAQPQSVAELAGIELSRYPAGQKIDIWCPFQDQGKPLPPNALVHFNVTLTPMSSSSSVGSAQQQAASPSSVYQEQLASTLVRDALVPEQYSPNGTSTIQPSYELHSPPTSSMPNPAADLASLAISRPAQSMPPPKKDAQVQPQVQSLPQLSSQPLATREVEIFRGASNAPGQMTGIGIVFGKSSPASYYVITSFNEGTAKQSGQVQLEDYLLAVDGVNVTDMSVDQIRSMIIGQPGTKLIPSPLISSTHAGMLPLKSTPANPRMRNPSSSPFTCPARHALLLLPLFYLRIFELRKSVRVVVEVEEEEQPPLPWPESQLEMLLVKARAKGMEVREDVTRDRRQEDELSIVETNHTRKKNGWAQMTVGEEEEEVVEEGEKESAATKPLKRISKGREPPGGGGSPPLRAPVTVTSFHMERGLEGGGVYLTSSETLPPASTLPAAWSKTKPMLSASLMSDSTNSPGALAPQLPTMKE
ncbi:hypothetical protein GUITHDRAFT_132181 [Guillardia theta CCMP2712]|uniref:PDZ domain-containing protein n=1 Tax=Guillardia theta (strain CCMP2712) TaxID=905079 RepID=L1K258_GUITC|nr:hypothetical protein GUITHDRAFT_132181 [Guillardia theta CCMP2712]EKX54453.1 hypothetical protein GUITHDRAFT_132181 [Guillardia theta CCMP2712]|eukprot:XP_005841433.1 hypothetical protein GUITHDRAFT_132181 [Guillardia theta CCMP2712]